MSARMLVVALLTAPPCLAAGSKETPRATTRPYRSAEEWEHWTFKVKNSVAERKAQLEQAKDLSGAALRDLLRSAPKSYCHQKGEIDYQTCLCEIIRRGGAEWIAFIENEIQRVMSLPDDHRERWRAGIGSEQAHPLEYLTVLCRLKRQSDPLQVIVVEPRVTCEAPDYPVFRVKLTNKDEARRTIGFMTGLDYRSGRMTRFSLQVRDSDGQILPIHSTFMGPGGGLGTYATLKFGESVEYAVPMVDYVAVERPGVYTIRVLYATENIADRGHSVGYLVYRSDPVTVEFTTPRWESNEVVAKTVQELLARLPDEGPVLIVDGRYGPPVHDAVPPETPVGRLLTIGWPTVPTLIGQLGVKDLTPHRRAWLLALLYSITGYNDPRGPRGRMLFFNDNLLPGLRYWTTRPSGGGMFRGATPDHDVRGSGSSTFNTVDVEKQKAFARKWVMWRQSLKTTDK